MFLNSQIQCIWRHRNFKNLWLWLLQRFCALELEYNQPQQMLWNGIYHPNADKVYTSLEEYQVKNSVILIIQP